MACLLLAALSCTGGGDERASETPEADEHTAPIEVATDLVSDHEFSIHRRQVAVAALPTFEVHEDVVVESVTVGTASGTVDLLDARVAYEPFHDRCLRHWPPTTELLGTSSVAGTTLLAGHPAYLLLFLKAASDAVVDQVVVRYRHEDEHTELRWNAVKVALTIGTPGDCHGGF